MSKYFSIDGYWKDDKSEFNGYIVKEYDDCEPTDEEDDLIFFYGLSESDLQDMVDNPNEGVLEFIVTSFEEINKP